MDINFVIGAITRPFQTGMQNVKSAAADAKASIVSQFAGAFAVGGIVAGFRMIVAEMERVVALAARFNVPAESIQRMSFAAKQNSTDVETMAKSVQKSGQVAAAAAEGNKAAADAFGQLGINAAQFLQMTPEERLVAVARGMENIQGAGNKLNAALAVLGKGAGELMPLLMQGGDAVAEQFASATVVSEGTARAIESAGDQIDKLIQQLKVWGAEILGLVDILMTSTSGVVAKLEVISSGFFEKLRVNANGFKEIWKNVWDGNFDAAKKSFERIQEEVLRINKRTAQQVDAIQAQTDRDMAERLSPAQSAAGPALTDGGTAMTDLRESLEKELAKIQEEAALRRLSIEEQITKLKQEQMKLQKEFYTTTDPERAKEISGEMIANSRSLRGLEDQAAKEKAAEEKRIADEREKSLGAVQKLEQANADRRRKMSFDSLSDDQKRVVVEDQIAKKKADLASFDADLSGQELTGDQAVRAREFRAQMESDLISLEEQRKGLAGARGGTNQPIDQLQAIGGRLAGVNYAFDKNPEMTKQTQYQSETAKNTALIAQVVSNLQPAATAEFGGA